MKVFFSFFCLVLFCFSLGHCVDQQVFLTKNQVLLTNEGIFIDYQGVLTQANSLEFLENSYIASINNPQVGRVCRKCGSNIGPDGKCENASCSNSGRNGPRKE